MEDTSARLLTQIVAKLRNPVLLFTISFGLILLSIGIYCSGKTVTLVVSLLFVFVSEIFVRVTTIFLIFDGEYCTRILSKLAAFLD
jgi:hypothetical membrane protein